MGEALTIYDFLPAADTPAKRRAYLEHYAAVLTREADFRGVKDGWMRDGAARALREAAAIDLRPSQPDLFGSAA